MSAREFVIKAWEDLPPLMKVCWDRDVPAEFDWNSVSTFFYTYNKSPVFTTKDDYYWEFVADPDGSNPRWLKWGGPRESEIPWPFQSPGMALPDYVWEK